MKSTAGKELSEQIKILKKLSIVFNQLDDDLKEAISSHNIENVKTIIDKSAKAQKVTIEIKQTIASISNKLNVWITSKKEKYWESAKYHDMSERIGVFTSIDCALEELEEICLPNLKEIPEEADAFEEFIDNLDNLVYDMMSYINDTLTDIAYIQA